MGVVCIHALRLPIEIVSVFRIDEAPAVLRGIGLSGDSKAIDAVPDLMAGTFRMVGAGFSEEIKRGVVYAV